MMALSANTTLQTRRKPVNVREEIPKVDSMSLPAVTLIRRFVSKFEDGVVID
jgi:hypothetical protein